MSTEQRAEALEGVLERIVYANDENAWTVAKLEIAGQREPVTAVGNLLGVQPGESLRLLGRWITDRRYGRQFRVESYLTVQPATLVGIERYLRSGLVRGIGEIMAKRLVGSFGLQTLEVIENEPQRLTEVEGIGPVRRDRIRKAWEEQRGIKEVMLFLQSHGVSTAHAIRIYKEYKERAIAIVREDPYRLALDIFGIGFRTADRIAMNLGLSPTSPRRAEAGVLHVLGEFSQEGHLFVPRTPLIEAAAKILEIGPEIVAQAIDTLIGSEHLVSELLEARGGSEHPASEPLKAPGGSEHPASEPLKAPGGSEPPTGALEVSGERAVYLRSLHVAEAGTALLLRALINAPVRPIRIDIARALAWFEERQRIALAPEQQEAIRRSVDRKVLVITGGPGTGKTTLVNGMIQILERKGRRILLAAPTGRAAKRLGEATGREAKTIHRLLEFSPKTMSFERNQGRPLEADLVVVDEFSMVDQILAYNLIKAIPRACQLIAVGDVDQLPSVGPGNVLRDVIESGAVEVIRLKTIFRQAERSRIVQNAHRINSGQLPVAGAEGEESDFFFIERREPQEILETIKKLVTERVPGRFGIDPVEGVQVLTPMHRGTLGASNLNTELQQLLNPSGEPIPHGARALRLGDKVLQVRNNYELEVWNGDIGRIAAVDPVERRVQVRFEDRAVSYEFADLDELVPAYACSIHKSQGSEYTCVVIPLHTQHYVMLQRNLLYTAVTRGKRLVVIVGSRRALMIAVKNSKLRERFTRLKERLQAGGGTGDHQLRV